jgi:DNA-binding transcriptional LysR family regulator
MNHDAHKDAYKAADAVQGLKGQGVSLQQLRLFVTLAQHRNFTQVGNAFGITQSAVSRSIRELEELLELRLFDRTTRHVSLTDTGRALLPRIALLVDELEAALRFGQHVSTAESGAVSIASSSSLVASSVPALLASCRASYPNIALTLFDAPQSRVLELVRAGDADLGILIDPPNLDGLTAEALFSDALCAIVPARHPFASHATLRWSELHGVDLFLLDDDAGSYDVIARGLAEHGAARVRLQRLSQATSVMQMVAAGLGIGLQPVHERFGFAGAHGEVQAVPLWPSVVRNVFVIKRKNRTLQSQAACIWNHIVGVRREAAGDLQTAAA